MLMIITIPADAARDLLTCGLVACGNDMTLPTLTHLRIVVEAEKCTVLSTDRYRAVIASYAWADGFGPEGDFEPFTEHLVRQDVVQLLKVIPKPKPKMPPATVTFTFDLDARRVEVSWGDGMTIVPLGDVGEFPKVESLISGLESTPIETITLNPAYLSDIAKMPFDRAAPVVLAFHGPGRPLKATTTSTASGVAWQLALMPIRLLPRGAA
jgi:hypothetical protein